MAFDDEAEKIVTSMEIVLVAEASKTAITLESYIQSQLASGISPAELEGILLDDLKNGGRIFGEFIRGIGSRVKGGLQQISRVAYEDDQGIEPETELMWIAILVNTCDDCISRHGEVDTRDGWESRGLPGSGWSVCRHNCKCQLVDVTKAKEEPSLSKPIKLKGR